MQELRQSTEVKVRIGSAVDATDGVTPETGLTLGAADQAELLKHNGAATVDISGSTFAAITAVDGWYDLTLTAGNTDTLGQMTAVIQDSSLMAPIFRDFMVVTANYWDSKYSTDLLQVDIQHIANTNAGANLLSMVTCGYDDSACVMQADLTHIHGTALTETDGQLAAAFKKLFDVATPLLVASTVMRGTDGANTTVPDAAGIAATPAEVATALTDINLDHLVKIAVDTNWATTVHLDSVLGHIADVGTAATFNRTTDALEAIRDRGDAAWSAAAGNPNVLIDTTIATLATQTSFTLTAGSDIDDAYKDQAIVLYDASNNDYPSVRKVSAYTGATKTVTLDSAPDFTAVPGDGVKTFVTAPGTTAPTVGQIRAEMEGAGYKLALIEADTGELQTDWVNGGRLDLLLDAIPTTAMRGTDSANTTVPDVAGTAAALHATTDGKVDVIDAIADRILTATEIRQAAVNDAAATTTKFITNLAEAQNDFWNRMALLFTSGNNSGQMRRIKDYVGATKEVTLQTPLDAAPANADTFIITTVRAFITPDIEDIADAVSDELTAEHTITGSLSKAISDTLADVTGIAGDAMRGTDGANTTVPDAAGVAATPAEVATAVANGLTIDTIADSYATDGAQPTIAQGILAIQQMLQEKAITGTTLTVKKPDGSTVAMTFTLDSATAPTSITRAT